MKPYPEVLAGDSVFVEGLSFSGKAIKWFTQGRHEPKTKVSHVEKAYADGILQGAVWPKIRRIASDVELENLENGGYCWIIMRRTRKPTDAELRNMRCELDNSLGSWYSVLEFPTQALDGLIQKIFPKAPPIFRRLNTILPNTVCSGMASRADIAAGWAPDIAKYDSPDDSLDRMMISEGWYMAASSRTCKFSDKR